MTITDSYGRRVEVLPNGKIWYIRPRDATMGIIDGPNNEILYREGTQFDRADAEKLILWACGNLMLQGSVFVRNGSAWLILAGSETMLYEWSPGIKQFVSRRGLRVEDIRGTKYLSPSEAMLYGVKSC